MKNLKLFSASRIINQIRNDGIIDYLDLNNKKRKLNSHSISEKVINLPNKKIKNSSSLDYIFQNGYDFEDNIINEIKKKMKNNKNLHLMKTINKNNKTIQSLYNLTKKTIIGKKYEIILNGLLVNEDSGLYGFPDLIVKGLWIKKYIKYYAFGIIDNDYYIIDIKSSTLNLINKGELISNSTDLIGYKSQVYIYKEILDKIQNLTNNNLGFLMCKKYKYTLNKEEITKTTFECLGTIDYFIENEIKNKIINSLTWNTNLEKNYKNKSFAMLNNISLFPNMKNKYESYHSKEKNIIAHQNKEITLLWNCGIRERNNALKYNITKYNDKRLTPLKLGFKKNTYKYNILNKMLKILHNNKLYEIPKKNNYLNWRNNNTNDYYVDFETYYNEFNQQILYMIGIGNYNAKWNHTTFVLNNKNNKTNKTKNILYFENEYELIKNFIQYVIKNNISRLVHWSKAETIIFYKKTKLYMLNDLKNIWFDLLDVFRYKEAPIIIKNCFSFNLKKIINQLFEFGLVKLKWEEINDGLLSMFIAKDIYNNTFSKNESNEKLTSLIKYNEIDCKALYELFTFIRKYK